jgi:hypothetical protein
MKTKTKMSAPSTLGLAAVALLGVGGCSTYKYFDIHVSFDPSMYDSASVGNVTRCRVTASGAGSGTFYMKPGLCPNRTNMGDPLDAGTFEFSTFAESGTITFKVDTYTSVGIDPACISGTGSSPVMVGSPSVIKGEVVIKKTGVAACQNVTGPMDASVDL